MNRPWLSSEAYAARARGERRSLADRFWEKVEIRSDKECWPWLGARDSGGYGLIDDGTGRTVKSNRVALLLGGVELGDLHVLHCCDHPWCCNPAHLFLGTHIDNMRDRERKGRGKPPPTLIGSANAAARLDEYDVRAIRCLMRAGARLRLVAAEFAVSQSNIRMIVSRKTWKHIQRTGDEPWGS